MPLYEFKCAKCGETFEELVRSNTREALKTVACPSCGSGKVKKQISTFASKIAGGGAAQTNVACAPGGT